MVGNVLDLRPNGGTMTGLLEGFRSYQMARGFSTATMDRRTSTIRRFVAMIAPVDIRNAVTDDVEVFLNQYRNPRTRHAYRSDLSVFYTWACRRNLIAANPMILIDPVKVPKSLPRPVPAATVVMLVQSAPSVEVALMVALAGYAGLRVMEIANIGAEDIDLTHGVLMVRAGKGGKDRAIPLHPVLARLVVAHGVLAGPMFPYCRRTVGRKIAEHMEAMGVSGTPHKLRASFATELAEMARGNIVLVQRLLGHASPETTMLYVGWGGGEAAATVATMYGATA